MRPLLPAALALAAATLLRAETPTGRIELLNGKDLSAWELVVTPATPPTPGTASTGDIAAVCTYLPDGSLAVAGKPVSFLATRTSYENYQLHAEWRWPAQPGNGGILLHIATGPKDRQWPLCFQVQTKHKSVGDVLPMAGATFAEPLTSAPGANPALRAHDAPDSEKPAGEWNTCDIVCRGGTIEVTINGVAQNRITKASPAGGRIGFQLEGVAFELRKVRLEPLPRAIGDSPQIPAGFGTRERK